MNSMVLRMLNRGIGRRPGDAGSSMEFADLLDDISPQPMVAIPVPDTAIADLVMFRVSPLPNDAFAPPIKPSVEAEPDPVVESSEEITVVSRFADSGINDDLLPVRAPSRSRLRR